MDGVREDLLRAWRETHGRSECRQAEGQMGARCPLCWILESAVSERQAEIARNGYNRNHDFHPDQAEKGVEVRTRGVLNETRLERRRAVDYLLGL